MPSHSTRVTLDVVMENFWTRPSGVYRKPVWLREGVLQLFYDDDNDEAKSYRGSTVPGGTCVFTGTASVYSRTPLTADDLTIESPDPWTNKLRREVPAYVQRVGSCYLVQANLLGFAGQTAGMKVEQTVLSSALKWALSDYSSRNEGSPPEQIVMHLDVNGTLALGDLAGSKTFGKMANGLARDLVQMAGDEKIRISKEDLAALEQAKGQEEGTLKTQYTANYSRQDFIRALVTALGALAPAAIRELDEELAGDFAANFRTKSAASAFEEAQRGLESPAITLAIRTNGTEHRQAAVYVQRLVHCVLGLQLSEESGTIRRYLVTHRDPARNLFFHPVLLEKLHKDKSGTYGFAEYAEEINTLYGEEKTSPAAWQGVAAGALKKSDPKFKVYLGLCKTEDDKPASYSKDPPELEVRFTRETWLMPGGKHNDYRCKTATFESPGPWWAGFTDPKTPVSRKSDAAPEEEDKPPPTHQPYNLPIATEPVPGLSPAPTPRASSAPSSPSRMRHCAPLDLQAMRRRQAVAQTRLPSGSPAVGQTAAQRLTNFDVLTPRSYRHQIKTICVGSGAYDDPEQVTHRYEDLILGRVPRVNPLAKEMYLTDEEFARVFGCDKDTFYAQKAWRRRALRQQAKLY